MYGVGGIPATEFCLMASPWIIYRN